MRSRLAILLALVVTGLPAIAYAAAPKNFCELVNFFVTILNAFTGLFVLAALATYLYGISMNIRAGNENRQNLRNIILWGIVGLFVMVSVWGILRILQETLFEAAPGTTARSGRAC